MIHRHAYARLRDVIRSCRRAAERHVTSFGLVHELGHATYFGLVYMEGHSMYATVAGGLFFVTLLVIFAGGSD